MWPSGFDGLHLPLARGWYPLPTHIAGSERRRLLALIAAGVEEIDYIAELDWTTLDELGERINLGRTLALVWVPASVEVASEETLRQVRAKLGRVRVGLLQHEKAETWPALAWQERQLKVPLLAWLVRQLRVPEHPLAQLGLWNLPLDKLARLTPEPIELLEMLEQTIAHRMHYRTQGMEAEDWERSIRQVAVRRFALRLEQVPAPQRAHALELAITHHGESTVAVDACGGGALALARAGLASHGGNDVLLGPLVRYVGGPKIFSNLLIILDARAWSPTSRRALRRQMLSLRPLPRAVLVIPEPPYSRWPAIVPDRPSALDGLPLEVDTRRPAEAETSVENESSSAWVVHFLRTGASGLRSQRSSGLMDRVVTLLLELDDARRFEIEREQGKLTRFEPIDRAWADDDEGGVEIRAYLRWLALTRLLAHATDQQMLAMLASQVAVALEHPTTPILAAALHALSGDLHARCARYHDALRAWERARECLSASASTPEQRIGHLRLDLRCALAHLRLDQAEAALEIIKLRDIDPNGALAELEPEDRVVAGTLGALLAHIDLLYRRLTNNGDGLTPVDKRPLSADARTVVPPPMATAAVALEAGDWVRAFEHTRTLKRDLNTSEGTRAQLLWATILGTVGNIDAAATAFAELRELADARQDALLLALSHRGLATMAALRHQSKLSIAALEAALTIERELGLPDAALVELEIAGWQVLTRGGQEHEAKLARLDAFAPGSPSLAAASLDAQLRLIAMVLLARNAAGEAPPATVVEGLELLAKDLDGGELSPWFDAACEQLLDAAQALIEAGGNQQALALLNAISGLTSEGWHDSTRLAALTIRAATEQTPPTEAQAPET